MCRNFFEGKFLCALVSRPMRAYACAQLRRNIAAYCCFYDSVHCLSPRFTELGCGGKNYLQMLNEDEKESDVYYNNNNNNNNNNFRVSNIRVSNRTLIYNVCPEAALT